MNPSRAADQTQGPHLAEPAPPSELTLRAIGIGLFLAVVMGAANVYLGLKAGLTVSASIPAAVLGSLLLRPLSRGRTLLEANQIQTAASAGESLAAGIIFTMPALVMIGYWQTFEFWSTTLIAATGGLLGILFMIPMRRVFVIESPHLPYPEGLACSAVLTAMDRGGDARSGARSILTGGLLGVLFKTATSGLGIVHGSVETAWATSGGRVLFLGADLSPALVAVGFIVRLNVALLVGLGGAIGWLLCIPLLPELGGLFGGIGDDVLFRGGSAVEHASRIWSTQIRYIGVGAMLVGGLASLWSVRLGLARAVAELRAGFRPDPAPKSPDDAMAERSPSGSALDPRERDLSPRLTLGLGAAAVLGIVLVYFHFTGHVAVTLLTGALMLVLTFFFVAVASYIVGLVGNSNSPVSGMTITAVLVTALLLYVFGYSGMEGMVATLGVAAIVCCAACTSGDVCNDLKTGYLVGASPRRQQIMQVLGVAVASLVMAPVLQLLDDAYGIGSRELAAPQAGLFKNLVQGFFGDGALPWNMVQLGVVLGLLVLAIDDILARRGSTFRLHLMPVAVGVYLPFGLAIPIVLGGVMAHLHARTVRRSSSRTTGETLGDTTLGDTIEDAAVDAGLRRGVLFCSGSIAGEALTGLGLALVISGGISIGGLEVPGETLLTALAAFATLYAFYRCTRPAHD